MEGMTFRNLNPNRKFKGIWVPEHLWFYEGLTINEKVFYLEIDSLDNENGCFASNDYFSRFSGLSKSRCSEIITSLGKKGIIYSELTYKFKGGKRSKEIDKRIIRVNQFWERNIRTEYENQFDAYKNMVKNRKTSQGKYESDAKISIRETEEGVFEKPNGVFEKPKDVFEKPKDSNTLLGLHVSSTNDDNNIENQSSSEIDSFKEIFKQYTKIEILLTDKRKFKIAVLLSKFNFEYVTVALQQINFSKYLQANISVDKFLEEETFIKIYEGFYKDIQTKGQQAKFNNMYQHGWNFEELEILESEYIDRKLRGEE